MSKTDQLRALREAKTAKVDRPRGSKAKAKAKPPKAAKLNHGPNGGEIAPTPSQVAAVEATMEAIKAGGCPTCGRFWSKGSGSFDKKAYMRGYMAERRRKTKPETTA